MRFVPFSSFFHFCQEGNAHHQIFSGWASAPLNPVPHSVPPEPFFIYVSEQLYTLYAVIILKIASQKPVPKLRWNSVLDGSKDGGECIQFSFVKLQITGSEDCLYLNVNVPEVKWYFAKIVNFEVFLLGLLKLLTFEIFPSELGIQNRSIKTESPLSLEGFVVAYQRVVSGLLF